MKKKAEINYNNQMENFKMIYVLWFIKMLKKCLIWFSKYFSSIPLHLCFFQFQFDTQIYNFYIKTTYFFLKKYWYKLSGFLQQKISVFLRVHVLGYLQRWHVQYYNIIIITIIIIVMMMEIYTAWMN